MTATVLTALVTAVLSFLAKVATDYLAWVRGSAADRQAGASEQAQKTNQDTADAERRAAQASVDAARGDRLDDDLASGQRGF